MRIKDILPVSAIFQSNYFVINYKNETYIGYGIGLKIECLFYIFEMPAFIEFWQISG